MRFFLGARCQAARARASAHRRAGARATGSREAKLATFSSPAAPAPAALWHKSGLAELRPALVIVVAVTAARVLFIATAPLELDFEEAQYWHWAQQLAWGYYSKPPLVAWLIA